LSSLYSAGYYPQNTRSRSAVTTNPLNRTAIGKEAEVDHLTDLLVQSMENSSDPDFFGELPIALTEINESNTDHVIRI